MKLVVACALFATACGTSQTAAKGPASAPLVMNAPPEPAPPEPEPPPPPPEPATWTLADGRIAPSRPITYATGSADLTADARAVLDGLVAFLAEKDSMTLVRIEVHTDAQGATGANQALSEARALTVAKDLVAHGVACERLIAVGFGETKPIADNATAEGRAANRRTEVVPAALRGHLIGGMPADGGGVVAGDPCAQ